MEKITGTIDRLIFHSAHDGFSVFVLTLNSTTSVFVNGYFPALHPGEEVHVEGTWVFHKKFGKQFHASSCIVKIPTSITGLKKYLASGLIKGIGPIYAQKLVSHFGRDILQVIEQNPHRLAEIPGIGTKRIEQITLGYKKQKDIAHVMVFLQEKNISPLLAAKIYKTYGNNALSILMENPYRLADEIWGVGFKTADAIAQKLGFDQLSLKRIEAAFSYCFTQSAKQGHLYREVHELKKTVADLVGLPQEEEGRLKGALHNLHERRVINVITYQEKNYVTTASSYYTEKGVADLVNQLLSTPSSLQFDLNAIYQELRTPAAHELSLHEHQQRGCMAALTNKITLITGGPGTGKTTLIKKLLAIFDAYGVRYKLAAPTGRAARRMMEGTGRHALTIHRLLEFDPSTKAFKYNETHALKLDVLIVDEASMVDIFLAYALLKALPRHAHLMLLGDVNQLPSVGAGNFLNDLIASEKIPCIRLTYIFRQAQDSLIIVNAHRVNNGQFPIAYVEGAKRDYIFIQEDKVEEVPHHLQTIFNHTLKKYTIPHEEAMVLAPMNRGVVGTQTFNHYLQNLLNTTGKDYERLAYAGTTFQVGDRVMQIRNNYEKGVFNGDIGTITHISLDQQNLSIDFDKKLVEYEGHELDEIVLSYAVSIHKSQGSEFSAVIIVIFTHHFTLLQRNLLYTAITRAKKLCIIIGQPKALAMAINNTKSTERITFLKQYLTSDLQAR